jgi:hypothetical protein
MPHSLKFFLKLGFENEKNNVDIKIASDRLIPSTGANLMNKKKCARKGCKKYFDQIVPWKIYCGSSCKQMAWLLRKLNKTCEKKDAHTK